MSILIIMDSRGRGLQEIFDTKYHSLGVKVLVHPGAGSELAALKSIPDIRRLVPKLIVLATGICDLTWRNRDTREVGLRHDTTHENVKNVTLALNTAYELIQSCGDYRVALATLTGADLSDCNHSPRKRMSMEQYLKYCINDKIQHPSQNVLNDSVLETNRHVLRINKRNGIKTVWLAGLVHAYYKKSYHHCYKRLIDGCHLDQGTKLAWANQINKSLIRILDRNSPAIKP